MVPSEQRALLGDSFEQSLKRLREETDAVLVEGLIHTITIVLVSVGILALGDPLIHPPYVVALYVQKSLLFMVGVGVAIALFVPSTRRWPRFFGVLFISATAVSCAVQGAITGDAVAPAPLLMSLMIGAAVRLPWGVLPQAIVATITALALMGNGYAVTGSVVGGVGVSLFIGALSTFVASVYLAYFLEQQRRAWRAQGMQLAETARHGDGRFGGTNDGLWDWSIETGEVYYSSRWKEIVGAAPDEIGARLDEWRRRIHTEDAALFQSDLLDCIDGQRPQFENEHRVRRQDGSFCWVLARGQVSRNDEGRAIRIAGSLTDISKRKRIEAALNESERKYRDMIENLTDVVFAVDTEGRFTYLSPVAEVMFGYSVDALIGRSAFEHIHPKHAPFAADTLQRVLAGDVVGAGEFAMQKQSGSWMWVRSHGRRFEIDGNVAGLRGTFTDITERKRAERERERLFVELQTANQVKEHFVATLTHELRNPINAISGYHSLLLDDVDDLSNDQRDLLERAERCTMELNALILATLDLSRFQETRVSVDWQDLSVCDLLSELSSEMQPPRDKPGLALRWNPAPDSGMLHTDPLKLKMALRNLVTNAVKFTEQGEVRVDAHRRDDGVEFRVSDTGIGIPAKALSGLFKPFTQAHGVESRRRGGAGLGLHLVKRLVEILGGRVEVESQVGRGSTFCIWLPRDGSLPRERDRTERTDVAA